MSKRRVQPKKPRTIGIGIDFSKVGMPSSITIGPDGGVTMSNSEGQISLATGSTALSYPRAKGQKITVQLFETPGGPAFPVAAIGRFARVFAVDTNSRDIRGETVAVSVTAELRNLVVSPDGSGTATLQPLWARGFWGIDQMAERVGWHEALLCLSARSYLDIAPTLLVVDAYLSELPRVARKELPVWDNYFLPGSMTLAYASTDHPTESPLNGLIRICDRVSGELLSLVERDPLASLPADADPRAPYRAWRSWEICQ